MNFYDLAHGGWPSEVLFYAPLSYHRCLGVISVHLLNISARKQASLPSLVDTVKYPNCSFKTLEKISMLEIVQRKY